MAIACRLAAERRTSVTAISVIEVPAELPLDAHMTDEEEQLKPVLAEASAIAELYGVRVQARTAYRHASTVGGTIRHDAPGGSTPSPRPER